MITLTTACARARQAGATVTVEGDRAVFWRDHERVGSTLIEIDLIYEGEDFVSEHAVRIILAPEREG